jgi:hypothetical protein
VVEEVVLPLELITVEMAVLVVEVQAMELD